jgi:hypothetical protein
MAQRIADEERILPRIRKPLRTTMPERMRAKVGETRFCLQAPQKDRKTGRREAAELAVDPRRSVAKTKSLSAP